MLLKSVVPAAAKATFMTLFFWTGVSCLLAISVPCRITLEVFQKRKVRGPAIRAESVALEVCPEVSPKRRSKHVIKPIQY